MGQQTWEHAEQRKLSPRRVLYQEWDASGEISQLHAGAIIPTSLYGIYQIQAHTAQGTRNFKAIEEPEIDLQSEISSPLRQLETAREAVKDQHRLLLGQWKTLYSRPENSVFLTKTKQVSPRVSITEENKARTLTTDLVLNLLRDESASADDKRKAVLNAEVLSFDEQQQNAICEKLHEFVVKHRESNNATDLVAVGAAIRKLVAYLPTEKLSTLVDLLAPTPRLAIPIEVELEVAKTVVRKLVIHPPAEDDSEPELAERLFDIAATYLNPRLLPREKHGATALNATLSLLLLRSHRCKEVTDLVSHASTGWFTQLVCRRANRMISDLCKKDSGNQFKVVSHSLSEFVDRLCHEKK